MTYKYYEVRRQIYEKCSDKPLRKYRTISEVRKVFKKKFIYIFIFMMLCLIVSAAFLFTPHLYKLISLFPMGIIYILLTYLEFKGEKIYVPLERKKELYGHTQSYEEYIESIIAVLAECGLKKRSQWQALKSECEKYLNQHAKNYDSVGRQSFNMLVGVPLGALISALIYQKSDVAIEQILFLVLLGLIIIACSKIFKKISYYSDGRFKDQYLLNVLNELEYVADKQDSNPIKPQKAKTQL